MIDHTGIVVSDFAASKAFYSAALAANYYGAFVHDPDGHNIEAVCHDPEDQ
jgi:catechol 2,3-dioxygenase-like lactoylglutathione lyase family enzyme